MSGCEVSRAPLPHQLRQRLAAGRLQCRTPLFSASNNSKVNKPALEKIVVPIVPYDVPLYKSREPRPVRSRETQRGDHVESVRSPGRTAPDSSDLVKATKPEKDRSTYTNYKSSTLKRTSNIPTSGNKSGRNVMSVPSNKKPPKQNNISSRSSVPHGAQNYELKIKNKHDLSNRRDGVHGKGDDSVTHLKTNYQEEVLTFEKQRQELDDKIKNFVELQAKIQKSKKKIEGLGHAVQSPDPVNFPLLNLANINQKFSTADNKEMKAILSIDVKKVNQMPNDLVATCEHTLLKRSEIINWLDSLVKSQNKGVKEQTLINKINEYAAENEMLSGSLEKVKNEFLKNINDLVSCLRKHVSDTTTLHLRNDELIHEIAEKESKIINLRKQLQASENLKSSTNKVKLEKLEKMLSEEKCKNIVIKKRLIQAEGQLKMSTGRAEQLEEALNQARSQAWSLERSLQQLHDQNEKLKSEFDQELSKLTSSIKENTTHLEEIEQDRERLQSEKEDLEKRLNQLSETYNQSMQSMKQELKHNVTKVIEAEQKYNSELQDKNKLETKVEFLTTQLMETQLRLKDKCTDLETKEHELKKIPELKEEIEESKREIEKKSLEIDEYSAKFSEQTRALQDVEVKLKDTTEREEQLKSEIANKQEYITQMEEKLSHLERQNQESDKKMEDYEQQLSSLLLNIKQLQEDFGDFENLNELRDMVHKHRANLLEATRQNGELAEALQKKDIEIEQHVDNLNEQLQIIMQKEDEIKVLHNNLEIRAHVENELHSKLDENEAEIKSLITNLETRKLQISQLEKIIITLEDQNRKGSLQKREDQEKISALQNKIAQYESYYTEHPTNIESPTNNLDNLIKILENELDSPLNPKIGRNAADLTLSRNNNSGDFKKKHVLRQHKQLNKDLEIAPTKINLGNFIKKSYNIASSDEKMNIEKVDRTKAITSIDPSNKWIPRGVDSSLDILYNQTQEEIKRRNTLAGIQNIQQSFSKQSNEEKKYTKMLKLAGHRLNGSKQKFK